MYDFFPPNQPPVCSLKELGVDSCLPHPPTLRLLRDVGFFPSQPSRVWGLSAVPVLCIMSWSDCASQQTLVTPCTSIHSERLNSGSRCPYNRLYCGKNADILLMFL